MHIKVKKADLLNVLSKIQGIIEKRNIVNILNHFLLDVSNNNATIYATDNELFYRIPIEVEVFAEGKTCIPVKVFREIVKELNEDIEIKLSGARINIQSGNSKFNLAVLTPEDFPVWMEIKEDMSKLTLSKELFLTVIEKTIYAAGEADARYVLNGLLFHIKGDSIHFVGTDGHRLAHIKAPFSVNTEDYQMILPKKTVSELKKLLSDADTESITLEFSQNLNFMQCTIDEIKFRSRTLQGVYPDYEAVILRNNDKEARVDKNSLISSLKRVSIISRERNNVVVTMWQDKTLTISSQDPEIGEANDFVDVDYQGEPITIGFNANYLIEALEGISTEKVKITMLDPDRAVYITDMENQEFLYECVVMPVRL